MSDQPVAGLRKRLLIVISTISAIFVIGTGGYMLIEGWPLLDAFYMTAITLTTVGFGEVHPLSVTGRTFTVILLLLGAGTVAYSLSVIGEHLLVSGIGVELRRRRMEREIATLKDHIIVCGYGRVGQNAAATLEESKRDFLIVEHDADVAQEARNAGHIVVEADATRDETLEEAGIRRAKGLIACTGSDPDNLFIVLSARTLNPELRIIVRSSDPGNEAKMQRAGADRVVSPYQIGGRHMVNMMIRPRVAEFMDVVTLDSGLELWLEDVRIGANSPLAGKTVFESDLRRRTGVTLVALMRGESETALTPDANTRMQAGDELIVLGTSEQLRALAEIAGIEDV